MLQLLWRSLCRFLQKLKIELPYDLAIPLLGAYPKELKSGFQRDISTPMFFATLFTTVPANSRAAGEEGSIPGSRKSLEEEMATHSNILA